MTDSKKYQFNLPKTGAPGAGAWGAWGVGASPAVPVTTELPDDAAACLAKGNTWLQGGRVDEALRAYDRAIALNPDLFEAHFNRGNVLLRRQRPMEALAAFERTLALAPDLAIAHYNRATLLAANGREDEAMAGYERTLALDPAQVQARFNLGTLHLKRGEGEQALACMDAVIQQAPNVAEAHNNRGSALMLLQRVAEAGQAFDRAVALKPGYAEAISNRGGLRLQLNHHEAAIHDLREAVRRNPAEPASHRLLGALLRETGDLEGALAEFHKVLELAPEAQGALSDWVGTLAEAGDWAQLPDGVARLQAAVRDGRGGVAPAVAVALIASPELQLACAQQAAGQLPAAQLGPLVRRPGSGKLRIGYFSADFHEHAGAARLAALFERHDRDHFEWLAFSYGPVTTDDMHSRLRKPFHQFMDVRERSDREIAQLARELGVDVAVDLNGYARGGRPGIFVQRCAPVQVGWLGWPATTGVAAMDYFIADRVALPAALHPQFTEKVVSLRHTALVGEADRRVAEVDATRDAQGLPADAVVFCAFHPMHLITPVAFDGWMRILQAVPGSVLWLLDEHPVAGDRLRAAASARGVDAARLVFAPRAAADVQLMRYALADVLLDSAPYSNATVVSDALWVGLPAVTLAGAALSGRTGASLLTAAELAEGLVTSAADYEASAIALAQDAPRRAALRERLLAGRKTSALFNLKALARQLESAYVAMDERSLQGLPPRAFDVRG